MYFWTSSTNFWSFSERFGIFFSLLYFFDNIFYFFCIFWIEKKCELKNNQKMGYDTSDGCYSRLKIGRWTLLLHYLKKRLMLFAHCKTKDCKSERKPSAAHDGSLLRKGFMLLTVAAYWEERLAFVADGVSRNQVVETSVVVISERK